MDNSSLPKSLRQTERMFHALRQRHHLLAQNQRLVGMAKVPVAQGRISVGVDATIERAARARFT
jgi:hypothetical protein